MIRFAVFLSIAVLAGWLIIASRLSPTAGISPSFLLLGALYILVALWLVALVVWAARSYISFIASWRRQWRESDPPVARTRRRTDKP